MNLPSYNGLASRFPGIRPRILIGYLSLIGLLVIAGVVYLLLKKPLYYGAVVLAVPVVLVIVINPRLALYQFLFCVFIEYAILPDVPVYLIDLNAMLVVAAAVLDLLGSNRLPKYLPPFAFNYFYLIAAFIVCGVVGYFPNLLPIRLATLSLLIATFFSLYRLISYVQVAELIKTYFWFAVAHSVYVLIPFVLSRGAYRSFGISGVLFDDLAVVALVVGLALYLGAKRSQSLFYLAGVVIVLGGLIATQSRLSIMFGVFLSAVLLVVAYSGAKHHPSGEAGKTQVRSRVRWLVFGGVVIGVVGAVVMADMLQATLSRFRELENPWGQNSTVAYRVTLWKRALKAFAGNPVFGLGPGGYYHMYQIYTTEHLSFMWYYLRTLGAHNMLLHYLADTGLVGGLGLLALVGNVYRHASRQWRTMTSVSFGTRLALFGWAILFLFTSLVEANWMWGQLSFLAVFFAALIAHRSTPTADPA